MRPRSAQDFCAGLLFVAVAAAGLFLGRKLEVGTASFMGTGYMPRLVCGVLMLIGIVVMLRAIFRDGPRLSTWAWRPLLLLTATILVAGFLIQRAGLVLTTIALVVIANYAGHPLKLTRLVALTVALVAFAVGLFHYGLALPIPVWPR